MGRIRESEIETALVRRVVALGGIAEKVTVLGHRGFFDRLIVLPGGRIIFCEVKKPKGGRVSAHQTQRIVRYRTLGAQVVVIHTLEDIEALLPGAL
jgi:hypothetical protein